MKHWRGLKTMTLGFAWWSKIETLLIEKLYVYAENKKRSAELIICPK